MHSTIVSICSSQSKRDSIIVLVMCGATEMARSVLSRLVSVLLFEPPLDVGLPPVPCAWEEALELPRIGETRLVQCLAQNGARHVVLDLSGTGYPYVRGGHSGHFVANPAHSGLQCGTLGSPVAVADHDNIGVHLQQVREFCIRRIG